MKKYKQISYDELFVHGRHPDTKYIRFRENQNALKTIAPYLYQAYEKRRSLYKEQVTLMKSVITVAEKLVILLRAMVNKKHGVPKTLSTGEGFLI